MFRHALRLRPMLVAALSAAPFSRTSPAEPVQTYRLPHEQQHDERHAEEPPEPAFLIKIDPAFAYYLYDQLAPSPSPPPSDRHVGVGGLGIGPPTPRTPTAPPPAPPPTASQRPSSSSPSSSSSVHPEDGGRVLAKTVLSTDASTSSSSSTQSSPTATHDDSEHSSFLAPFWNLVSGHTDSSSSSSSSSVPTPQPEASASAPPAALSGPSAPAASASDEAYLQGREVGRLETYRELEDYIARTESEKTALEQSLRALERQREEERLLALREDVVQVEALKRKTAVRGGAVCEEETKRVLQCYRQNMAQVLKCDAVVRDFAHCADRAKDAVLRAK